MKPLKILIIGKERRAEIKEIGVYSLLEFPDLLYSHSLASLPFISMSLSYILYSFLSFFLMTHSLFYTSLLHMSMCLCARIYHT